MISVTLQQVAQLTGGTLHGDDRAIADVTTDTRKAAEGSLFIALKGERFDAHDFVADAITAGCSALLVSKRLPVELPQVVVADTRIALGQLAAWVRQQSNARIVALTGSSGKTSVKEMTAAILRECGETLYTTGNFNNDIGVPLTLLRLKPEHRYAVIELGLTTREKLLTPAGWCARKAHWSITCRGASGRLRFSGRRGESEGRDF